ncbi:DUF5946 family protein [Modestobacter versicolor]|uniref:DUF5946 family protein n=1 Tax=Modestobacter versicolor TaxID=429133 RepID=UPI0034DEF5CC
MDATDTAAPAAEPTVCPGCGSVLVAVPGLPDAHPGASAGCAGLFAVTVRGLREEAAQDARTAALLQLATDAYDAQHLRDGEPAAPAVRLCRWLERDLDPARAPSAADEVAAPGDLARPVRWTTTVADLAADLDVVDLPSLVRSWAAAVWSDWAPAHAALRAAADAAPSGRDTAGGRR